MTRTSSDGDRT